MGYPGNGSYPLLESIKRDFKGFLPQDHKHAPAEPRIIQNFPNPFNPTTTITYRTYITGHVLVVVSNMLGEVVATLENGLQSAGTYSVSWNGTGYASGVYICHLVFGQVVVSTKMLLLK